jgi:hypothetical protein
MTEGPVCKKFPNKHYHVTKAEAYDHWYSLKKTYGEQMMSPWLMPYPCGDHWHVGRDWRRFNKQLKNALRVGRAASRRQRVRKRR